MNILRDISGEHSTTAITQSGHGTRKVDEGPFFVCLKVSVRKTAVYQEKKREVGIKDLPSPSKPVAPPQ